MLVVIWFLSFIMKHLGVTDPETRHPRRVNAKQGQQQYQQRQEEGSEENRDQGEQETQY